MKRLGVVLLAIVVIGGTVWGWSAYQDRIEQDTAYPARSSVTSPSSNATVAPPVVLLIGDSFSGGSDMNEGPEWPDMLKASNGWVLLEDVIGGTGYVSPGQQVPFTDRIEDDVERYAPDVVLLAGGRNDIAFPVDEVVAAADDVVAAAKRGWPDAEIVLFSPFASGEPSDETLDLARALQELAEARSVRWVDATGYVEADLIGSDGVHPNQEGHERLAAEVADALSQLDLATLGPVTS